MTVERIEEVRLSSADDRQIAALLAECFDTDFGGRSHFEQRPHLRFVLRETGRIVGHIGYFFRSVRQGERLFCVAGLGDVACAPDWRGRGVATALLQAAIAEAGQGSAAFVLLFGEAALYGGAGFVAVPNGIRFTEMGGARTGQVATRAQAKLMMLSLANQVWDTETEIDLLGHAF
jgi:predicted N-acetyltransferase YhbS